MLHLAPHRIYSVLAGYHLTPTNYGKELTTPDVGFADEPSSLAGIVERRPVFL